MLSCDLVVASEEASFGIPEVKRGLAAAAGGLMRLPTRIPRTVAMELALTGDPLSAADAHRWGSSTTSTPGGGALDGARELAERIGANGPLAVRASKQVIVSSPDWNSAEMWERQGRSWARCSPARTPARVRPPSPRSAPRCGRAA